MTKQERAELDAWLAAIHDTQPAGTMAMVEYVRDGAVTPQAYIKDFPVVEIPTALEHINLDLNTRFERALADADARGDGEEPVGEIP